MPRARFFARVPLYLSSVLVTLGLAGYLAAHAANPSYLTKYQTFSTVENQADQVVINEVDATTPGADIAEFVELYDSGLGQTSLDGLVLVFFNGQDDRAYAAFDLAGYQSDGAGYFLLGNQSLPGVDLIFADTLLQGGPDAVALYQGTATDFPVGTAVTTNNLQDAVVYDTGDAPDAGLLVLLHSGEPQVNEDSYTLADFHSNQRCPNGSGGARRTSSYIQALPTPKVANSCPVADVAPEVSSTSPVNGAVDVTLDADIIITFSEAVEVADGWFTINCTVSGAHTAQVSGGDTVYQLNPVPQFAHDDVCTATVYASLVKDKDTNDPPDEMAADSQWLFSTVASPIAGHLLINEVDTDTPGSDTAEFIELSAGAPGITNLDGLVVVLYNGSDDRSYGAYDLDGQQTNNAGYFVLGNAGVSGVNLIIPNGKLQNGVDAVALYAASDVDFPNGTPLTNENLLDALVYDTADPDDSELLTLLFAGEPQIDESGRGNPTGHSNQRCPDSSGGQRRTNTYLQNLPTPGTSNKCTFDSAPQVTSVDPQDGTIDVDPATTIKITFSEPVTVAAGWFEIACSNSGQHSAAVSGTGAARVLTPDEPFAQGDTCTVNLAASKIFDTDDDDPPDQLDSDYQWAFSTTAPVIADHMLINEVDADTPGSDSAEFIELYDGGTGNTTLDGLVVVLYNGSNDLSYRSFDLDGLSTDSAGYFLLGNAGVTGVDLTFGNSSLQNGADAVALYAGNGSDFPNGTDLTTNNLVDALVYGTADADDEGLLVLLHDGQPQIDESGSGHVENHSNQRCPNGQGGPRMSVGFLQNPPTPKTVNVCTVDQPPEVTSTVPLNGATGIAPDSNIMISFSEPVSVQAPWITLSCSGGGEYGVSVSGGPVDYQIDPNVELQPNAVCTATVVANRVTDLDGLPDAMTTDYSWSFYTGKPVFGACGDPAIPIHLIQGNGSISALVGATDIVVEGIVTADFQGQDKLEGFLLQQNPETSDDDPQTSEGIFIHDPSSTFHVAASEIVRLQGNVLEIDGMTSINQVTQLAHCGEVPSLSPQIVSLPVDSISYWEHIEGMLVHIPQTMAATGSDNLGREGTVELALSERLIYPTEAAAPGEEAVAIADHNQRSRITLDDGSYQVYPLPLPPYLGPGNTLRVGDTVDSLTGVLTESDSGYRIQPTVPISFIRQEPRQPAAPELSENLRLVSYDAGAYFNGDGQGSGFPGQYGAQTAEEFSRQRTKIISALSAVQADVLVVYGLENDGYGPYSAIQDLVNGLNDTGEGSTFAWVNPGLSRLGDTATAVGIIYNNLRVSPVGPAETVNAAPFQPPNNPPLVQTFAPAGSDELFVLAAAQFLGRDSCPTIEDGNEDQGDGQGCYALLRKQAAAALANWLATDPTNSGQDNVLILGNFNAYTQEDPLVELQNAGYTNLTTLLLGGKGYTSVNNGETGTLHHALATSGIAPQVQEMIQWHINAAEPAALDYRESNQPGLYQPDPYRSAVQDPLIIDLDLSGPAATTKLFLPITLFIE
ncbi:MAG: ExeM/NucH family extracellular endonuclease [Candidatus Promineifilaceae bacterium]|nr:ExeM/NucH family extracellular endonuclease [Candidatus Promineifilaceae bacterium]